MDKLEGTGLSHNPCQGCEAYYTRDGFLLQCVLDIDSDCAWIKIYRDSLEQPALEDFKNIEIGDWVEGVGTILTHFEKSFIRRYGHHHLTQQFSGQETPDEIWTNEDESAEIERQITEESCR